MPLVARPLLLTAVGLSLLAGSADRISAADKAKSALDASGNPPDLRTLAIGDAAPDFALPGVDGTLVRLSRALADGPVVLSFYRGGRKAHVPEVYANHPFDSRPDQVGLT